MSMLVSSHNHSYQLCAIATILPVFISSNVSVDRRHQFMGANLQSMLSSYDRLAITDTAAQCLCIGCTCREQPGKSCLITLCDTSESISRAFNASDMCKMRHVARLSRVGLGCMPRAPPTSRSEGLRFFSLGP